MTDLNSTQGRTPWSSATMATEWGRRRSCCSGGEVSSTGRLVTEGTRGGDSSSGKVAELKLSKILVQEDKRTLFLWLLLRNPNSSKAAASVSTLNALSPTLPNHKHVSHGRSAGTHTHRPSAHRLESNRMSYTFICFILLPRNQQVLVYKNILSYCWENFLISLKWELLGLGSRNSLWDHRVINSLHLSIYKICVECVIHKHIILSILGSVHDLWQWRPVLEDLYILLATLDLLFLLLLFFL